MRIAGLILTLVCLAASAGIAIATRGHVFLVFLPLIALPLVLFGHRRE